MFDDDFFFEKLKKRVKESIDFQTQFYGDKHLKRRFQIRMRALGIKTYREYEQLLTNNPEEYDKLIRVLTVNVTEWFRNPEVFEAIKKKVFPSLFEEMERNNRKYLRIWSIGCADGKEPYSVAILLHEFLGEKIKNFAIVIFASDIDREVLERARIGRYHESEMRGLNSEQIKKYFIKEDGTYTIIPSMKNLVKFEKRDLLKDRHHVGLDLILCRNVVIYFTRELKKRLYKELYNSLRKGGYFISGKTESIMGEARGLFSPVDLENRIYKKV
jgi:chemotaxis protein methyltransferase CheR